MHGRTDFPSAGLRVRTSTIYVICSCSLKSKDKISKAECTLFQLTDPKSGPLIFCKSYIYRLHSISFFLKIQLLQMLMWILRYNQNWVASINFHLNNQRLMTSGLLSPRDPVLGLPDRPHFLQICLLTPQQTLPCFRK